MGRAIDADMLKARFVPVGFNTKFAGMIEEMFRTVRDEIDKMPTVETPNADQTLAVVQAALDNGKQHVSVYADGSVSVWPQQAVAKWNKFGRFFQCSNCGKVVASKTNYCPDCGYYTKEDGDADETVL